MIGIRAFYTYVFVESYSKDRLLTSLQLLEKPQPHTVHREPPQEILRENGSPTGLASLKAHNVLRVCYLPDDYPSAFFNDAGNLVGFDIEMAHRFARYLDVALEFLPVQPISEAEQRVNSSYCNVFMALQPITPQRTERFSMTAPILNEPIGFIVKDYLRDQFRNWADLRKMTGLRVAFLNDPAARVLLTRMLPEATPILLQDKQELDRLLASGAANIDAIGAFAEEAAAWTIRYPNFTMIAPSPPLLVPSGYAVAHKDIDMLLYLDTWLLNAKSDGTIDELYRYWMLGEVKKTQPPRWSVIRNVLGWD